MTNSPLLGGTSDLMLLRQKGSGTSSKKGNKQAYSALAIVVDAALVCCTMRPTVMDPAISVKTMKANPILRKNPMSVTSFWVAGAFMMVSLVWVEVMTKGLPNRPCMVLEACIHLPFMWTLAL
jgi:hypothetical protein